VSARLERPARPRSLTLEDRAQAAAERAISDSGCHRVLIVYEPKAQNAHVYGEAPNGTPKKLEVLR